MELQEFITQTLTDIIQGIYSAQQTIGATGAIINAGNLTSRMDGHSGKLTSYDNPAAQPVEFDIALTVVDDIQSTKAVKASIINVLSSNLKSQDSSSEATVQRIRFTVPVVFPTK